MIRKLESPPRIDSSNGGCPGAVSPALVDRIGDMTGVKAIHLPIGCDMEALAAASLQPRRPAHARGLRLWRRASVARRR